MHVGDNAPIERHDVAETSVARFIASDDGGVSTIEYADDAPLDTAIGATLDSRDNPIAVHRLVDLRRGNVNVLSLASSAVAVMRAPSGVEGLGGNEPIAGGVDREPADHEVHLFGQTEAIAADPQQIARRDEVLELAFERRHFFARNTKRACQFASRGRMMDVLANQTKKIV